MLCTLPEEHWTNIIESLKWSEQYEEEKKPPESRKADKNNCGGEKKQQNIDCKRESNKMNRIPFL